MRLYKLQRNEESSWEEFSGFVIRASSAKSARNQANERADEEDNKNLWLDPKLVSCHVLTYEGKEGIILMDFIGG